MNPGLNNGNINNVRALATVLTTSIATTVTRTVAAAQETSISIAVAISLSIALATSITTALAIATWRSFVDGWLCSFVGGVVVLCEGVGELTGCEGYPRVESGILEHYLIGFHGGKRNIPN